MEGVVAKRTLKRSYYVNNNIDFVVEQEEKEIKEKRSKYKSSFKEEIIFRLALQGITTVCIFVFIYLIKVMNIDIVLKAEITEKLKSELNKSYTLSEIKEDVMNIFANGYSYIEEFVPDKLESSVKERIKNITNMFGNLNKSEKEVNIYEEIGVDKSENKQVEIYSELGIGTSVEEEKYITAVSSLSLETSVADKIKASGIKFVKPTTGTITSNFGAREVIFTDIDSYHTGVDIANKKGTKIVSSIDGKVTAATNNKYNGNYVVVENGDIKTIYCHLNKISVKKGTNVKAGNKIGEMGSTGYSTGPHLHFEIAYKGEKVNPRLVVDI